MWKSFAIYPKNGIFCVQSQDIVDALNNEEEKGYEPRFLQIAPHYEAAMIYSRKRNDLATPFGGGDWTA